MKKISLFLVAMFAMNLFSFAQSQMSGTYTVGTGGAYNFASMADAGMAIKSATFTGDVTLLICTDLTETVNTGIVNKSEYTLTIRPDKDENRTITYTTAKDNTGPTGVFVIGGDMTKTPGSTIGWASVPTKNVIVDGAAEGKTTPRLKITTGNWGTNFLLYGDVQDVVVKNCILVNTANKWANYAITFRSEKYSETGKNIGPKNCRIENCVLEATHESNSQTVYFQGYKEANSAAGYPSNITIRNCNIKGHTRGMFLYGVNGLNVEGCTFDMSEMASGFLCHGILGNITKGVIHVKGNKFIKNSTKNTYAGEFGLQTITASGGADVWVIENNYFAGYNALAAGTTTAESRLVGIRCGDYCVVRHNTFHMPKLTYAPGTLLVGTHAVALLWLAGSHKYPVQNNIFVCEETTANVSLIRGSLNQNENVTGNVFYHQGGNAAIVAGAPSCKTFADLENSYPTQAATSKWINVTFADAANGDLSLAGSSDGDFNLAVDRLGEVLTDINGKTRAEKTYAGAYEGDEFLVGTVTAEPIGAGTVEGGGTYYVGESVTLKATANEGYELLYWSDRSTKNPRTFTMSKNEALSAYFVKKYVVEPTFTIEKVWENTNVPAATANGYQAVGWDGKIYMQDAGNKKIVTYSSAEDTGTDYATGGGAGQQIAVDEAGNLIVFNAYFATSIPKNILIYAKGSTEGKAVSFTLSNSGQCHFFTASGDIYSAEGGYVYFYCQNTTVVNRVKIANGELVSVDVVGNSITAGNTQNHVMVDIFGNLVAHSRSAAINATINVHTNESMAFTLQEHKISTLGGCTFELGGKEFWAYNVGTNHYTSEWNIYNMTDGKFLSDTVFYAKNKTDKNLAANWLNVQVVDETTAYIYQFCPKVAVAVWKVTMHEVVLRDNENNEKLLTDLKVKGSTTNVSVYRSLTGGMYNTLCLPFDVNDLTGTPLENATVWQYNGATVKGEGTSKEIFLDFKEVESIAAGEPYLVEPAEDIAAPMEFKNVTISVTNGSEIAAHTAVTMHGILHPTELEENNKNILFLVANNNLAWANETANMNGMRAYFKVNDESLLSARTRAYIRREPTVATDMEAITTSETEIKKVIYNGNIYIIRGDEVYTIQGTKVK